MSKTFPTFLLKDRDAPLTFYDFPAEPPAIWAALGLNIHPGLLHIS